MPTINIKFANKALVISYPYNSGKIEEWPQIQNVTYQEDAHQQERIYRIILSSNTQDLIACLNALIRTFQFEKNSILFSTYSCLSLASNETAHSESKSLIDLNFIAIEKHFEIKKLMDEENLDLEECIGTYKATYLKPANRYLSNHASVQQKQENDDFGLGSYNSQSSRPKSLSYGSTAEDGFYYGTPTHILKTLKSSPGSLNDKPTHQLQIRPTHPQKAPSQNQISHHFHRSNSAQPLLQKANTLSELEPKTNLCCLIL